MSALSLMCKLFSVALPATSHCGLSLGKRGNESTSSCSQAHESVARRCDQILFAVRPGSVP